MILFVDRQRKSWVTEVQKEMEREIEQLRSLRTDDLAKLAAMEARVAQLENGNREGKGALADVMVGLARGMSADEAIEAIRQAAAKLH